MLFEPPGGYQVVLNGFGNLRAAGVIAVAILFYQKPL